MRSRERIGIELLAGYPAPGALRPRNRYGGSAYEEHFEFVSPVSQAMADRPQPPPALRGRGVIRVNGDELPHSRPSALGRTLLDEEATTADDAKGSSADQRRLRRFPGCGDSLLHARRCGLAVLPHRADQAL